MTIANPWFFPRQEEYRTLLEAMGFSVDSLVLIPRPTPLPGDMGGWLQTFAQAYTSALPASERPSFISQIVTALRPVLCNATGNWHADYVRLRFSARKP
jgi:hypothetical protein